MSDVPVILSAAIPGRNTAQANCLTAEMGMVVVLPRSSPFTWNSIIYLIIYLIFGI